MVNFHPEFVVIDSENNMTLTEVFQLTYSISYSDIDALAINTSLGNVTINEAFASTTVMILRQKDFCMAVHDEDYH